MNHEEKAKSLMEHYFHLTAERAGVKWDYEMTGEVSALVEHLIAAAQPAPAEPTQPPEWIEWSGGWIRTAGVVAIWAESNGDVTLRTSDGTVVGVRSSEAGDVLRNLGIETDR